MAKKQSSDYWERRKAQEQAWIKDNLKNDEAFNTKLRDYYERALDRIQAEIDGELQKLVSNGKVDVTNVQKSVSAEDMKRFEREAKELVAKASRLRKQGKFVTYDDFSREENARMRVYNVIMRVNRLEYLKAQIGLFLVDLGSDIGHELAEKLTDDYISEVKRQAGILGETLGPLWTNKEVARIIMAQTGSATFSQRLWANMDALKAELDGVIASGIIKGDNPREMARKLKSHLADTVKNHRYVTERLARTESARVQFSAQTQSIKEAGYKYCMWHDEPKACSICQAIAQHKSDYGVGVYELEKVPSIPVHPNCRCSISAYWVDELKNNFLNNIEPSLSLEHSIPFSYNPSSVVLKLADGKPVQYRVYDSLGKPKVDLTNHGAPKYHPIVPHAHDWLAIKSDGVVKYKRKKEWRELNQNEKNNIERWLKSHERK